MNHLKFLMVCISLMSVAISSGFFDEFSYRVTQHNLLERVVIKKRARATQPLQKFEIEIDNDKKQEDSISSIDAFMLYIAYCHF